MDARRARHAAALTAGLLLALLPVAAAAAATEDCGATCGAVQEVADTVVPAGLSVAAEPVLGDDRPDASDLRRDPGTGLPTVSLSPSAREQVALHRYVVTNVGAQELRDVAIVDERGGTVLDAGAGTVLAVGASITVEHGTTYRLVDAVRGTAGLVTSGVTASASTADGEVVGAVAETIVQVVAVLPSPSVGVDVAVVVDGEDVAEGPDGPTVSWSGEEAAAATPRSVVVRVTATNTGDVPVDLGTASVDLGGNVVDADLGGTTLEPGASTVVDVRTTVLPSEVAPVDEAGPVEVDLPVRVELSARDEVGAAVSAAGETTLHAAIVRPVPEDLALPSAGPPRAGELAIVALLAIGFGLALLQMAPRQGKRVWA